MYGLSMKRGMDAALADQTVQKRRVEFVAINDFYNPTEAVKAATQLIEKGIFAMVNSFGSPTTKAVLPLLAENKSTRDRLLHRCGLHRAR
ncbi:MAG: ABC transporter substrate-binding protein [Candidatus Competibacteraceae bacterium]